ncbi:PTS transporter subunit EIIC [Enterococcus avium]|uniref:PTS transporter subunit EIIC n=1 Tax=Enterococcus avium TaxID=33945 RepID=UPI0032E36D6C
MADHKHIANEVLVRVGGRENIRNVYHCMTRLRFELKDESIINLDDLKSVNGVLGAQFKEGLLQVIIGTTVGDVYQELVKLTGIEEKETIAENLDYETKKGFSLKSLGSGIINTFSNSMGPLVPLFVALGMINTIAIVIGPTFLKLVPETSDLYNNFYQVAQAIIYFLPVFVAITASKHFKANMYISVALAAVMLYPDWIDLLANKAGYTLYGISVSNVAYDSQIIPIILTVFVQSYVERILNKYIPNVLKVIAVGLLTIVIMLPLEFIILGPIGFYIGSALVNVVMGLYAVAGPLETTIISALCLFLTAFGIARPIFFACMAVLFSTGSESAFMPFSMVIQNFTVMGIALGYTLKEKDSFNRQTGISCFISAFIGGVSEPALFGIVIPNKKTYLPVLISGAIAGLYAGLTRVTYYQFGYSVLGFISENDSSNLINGVVASIIAFISAFAAMMIMYKKETGKKNVNNLEQT